MTTPPQLALDLVGPRGNAIFSACGLYRYALSRLWGPEPPALFVMLNPSTATDETNDPTIRRCIDFARRWGYGGLLVGNLFAWRATNKQELLTVREPTGGCANDAALEWMAAVAGIVVCAWGDGPTGVRGGALVCVRRLQAVEILTRQRANLFHLGDLTDAKNPRHPLYQSGASEPRLYAMGGAS